MSAKRETAATASRYHAAIGRSRSELDTPALVLDLDLVERNIAAMADWARGRVGIRPHVKTHKCVEIARLQVEAGACGLTTATVWEALALVEAGLDGILVANEVVDESKLDLFAVIARDRTLLLAVDSELGAEALSKAATRAGSEIGVLVDVDVGLHRCGVRSVADAIALAAAVEQLPAIRLRGVMGYEGHVVTEPDRDTRARRAAEAMVCLTDCVEQLEAAGFAIEIVSAGGTNTFDMTGANPRVTELQAGSYAVMDAAYEPLTPAFRPALTILARCISRQGETAVLDCGSKVAALEMGPPRLPAGLGSVREVHEEHTLLDVKDGAAPRVGDLVELVIGYCGGTVNLHDAYHVARGDEIVDIWPIVARGPGTTVSA